MRFSYDDTYETTNKERLEWFGWFIFRLLSSVVILPIALIAGFIFVLIFIGSYILDK